MNELLKSVFIFICLSTCLQAYLAEDDHFEGLALVEAKAIELTPEGKSVLTSLEVMNVYRGKIGVTEFTLETKDARGVSFSVPPISHFSQDEIGLFLLKKSTDGDWKVIRHFETFMFLFPVRETGPSHSVVGARFDEVKRLLEINRKVFNSEIDDKSKIALLKKYSKENESYVSAWALREIASLSSEYIEEFLYPLALKNAQDLPVLGQIALDEIMLEHPDLLWSGSDERVKIFRNWASKKWDKRDNYWVRNRLNTVFQNRELDEKTWFKLLERSIQKNGRLMEQDGF